MVAVGLYNNAFAALNIQDPKHILRARVPARKLSRIFRWKESKLKEPIFREPERLKGQPLTSKRNFLPWRAQTAGRYMKQLGRDVGLEDSLVPSISKLVEDFRLRSAWLFPPLSSVRPSTARQS
ncbi:hypothetical protein V2W45_272528 [Cenococcum geophilum]